MDQSSALDDERVSTVYAFAWNGKKKVHPRRRDAEQVSDGDSRHRQRGVKEGENRVDKRMRMQERMRHGLGVENQIRESTKTKTKTTASRAEHGAFSNIWEIYFKQERTVRSKELRGDNGPSSSTLVRRTNYRTANENQLATMVACGLFAVQWQRTLSEAIQRRMPEVR